MDTQALPPSPAEELTAAQQRVLLAYAKRGSAVSAAQELGVSTQTLKNHLSAVYAALGVAKGVQAIYVLMGGDAVAAELAPPHDHRRSPAPSPASARTLTRLTFFKDQARVLREANRRLEAAIADLEAGRAPPPLPIPVQMPPLVDGAIRIVDLRRAARLLDSEADPDESPQATLTEWIDALSYYVTPRGTSKARPA